MSELTPNKVGCLNPYDNRGWRSVAFSALGKAKDRNITTVLKSIGSRTLVRY